MASYTDAREAVYTAAVEIIKGTEGLLVGDRAEVLRDVALAVRYAAGGPQPGSGSSDK